MLDDYKNDLERAQGLQNILIATATGSRGDDASYKYLRAFFIEKSSYNDLLPSFVRTNREIGQFWQFIKGKFPILHWIHGSWSRAVQHGTLRKETGKQQK